MLQTISILFGFIELKNSLGNHWEAYRVSGNSNYGRLAYLVNTTYVQVLNGSPNNILNYDDEYNFAYRLPYVLSFKYQNNDFILINLHYKCCGDGFLDLNNPSDEENRRKLSSEILHNYIKNTYNNENVIIVGDMNDLISDQPEHNVFLPFLNSDNEYIFADNGIAYGPPSSWSYPGWPSHIDHIIISNEIYNNPLFSYSTAIPLVEDFFDISDDYDRYISDHRPVILNLNIVENE